MVTVLLDEAQSPAVGALVEVPEDERHHLRVRRTAADGREVRWTNGVGLRGMALLVEQGKRTDLEITLVEPVAQPIPLLLLVAAGDRERWAWMVEKATELGVTDLCPLETERSRHVASRLRETHLTKLQARAREACKQCGNAWAPRVHAIADVETAAAHVPAGASRWLADAEGASAAGLGAVGAVAVAVGPEGGFTHDERLCLEAAGFAPLRLGPHILRFETAAVAAAALLIAHRPESSA